MIPVVTALCLTRRRRGWLPKAIADFQAQDYPEKRMLILADTRDDVDGLVPADPDIRVECCHELGKPCPTIGAKRNLGCSLIESDLIAHWDDDDRYGPQRLSDQSDRLVATGKAMTGYHSAKFTNGMKWWKYLGVPQFSLGASLMYSWDWWHSHRFSSIDIIGEDCLYVNDGWARNQLATADATKDTEPRQTAADMMVVNMHAGNTSKKNPGCNWQAL